MPKQKKIVIIVGDFFQDLEVWYPYLRFKEAGHQVVVAGLGEKVYHGKYGLSIATDRSAKGLRARDFDAVVIPGGWAADYMRRSSLKKDIVKFLKDMNKAGQVISVICHGGWMLASADIIRGRTVTAFHSIKDDLINAGAKFVDREVVVDKNLITSRKPEDLPAFCHETLKKL